MGDQTAFKAFLSHRYRSPEVNRYFYSVFSESAEVQFEVDEGWSPMSVTRIERMIRDSDAFIGVYPFGTEDHHPPVDALLEASQYFRLEMDIAVRLGRPALVFYDQRYRNVLDLPSGVFQDAYDHQEVMGEGRHPSFASHVRTFHEFLEVVRESMKYEDVAASRRTRASSGVGVLTEDAEVMEVVLGAIEPLGYDTLQLDPKEPLAPRTIARLRTLDWVVVDWSTAVAASGIPALLHGLGVPVLRTKRHTGKRRRRSAMEKALYGDHDVGYTEDLIEWDELGTLEESIVDTVERITTQGRRINTSDEADDYFRGALRRQEKVFLSFAGKDERAALLCSEQLRRRFESVYVYKDPESLPPGPSWVATQFGSLEKADVGVILLSKNWMASGNCRHERDLMVTLYGAGEMVVYVVNLDGSDPPAMLKPLQYQPAPADHEWQSVADNIVTALDMEGAERD